MASQSTNSRSYLGQATDYIYSSLPSTPVGKASDQAADTLKKIGKTAQKANTTLKKVNGVSERIVKVLENPRSMTKDMVLGLYDALEELSPVERSFSAASSVISKTALSTLLHHGTFIGNPQEGEEFDDVQANAFDIIKERFDSLNEAENPDDELKKIREEVQTMHVLMGNFQLNPQPSSDESLRSYRVPSAESEKGEPKRRDKSDGTSPIDLVAGVQEQIRMLADKYYFEPRSPSSNLVEDDLVEDDLDLEESPENSTSTSPCETSIEGMRQKTKDALDHFSERVINYSTMYAVASILGEKVDPSNFNQLISKGGDLEFHYLKKYKSGSLSFYLHRSLFRAVRFLIKPLVTDTLTGVLERLRSFVTNEEELREFTKGKIEALSEYYARVDDARREYLDGKKPKEISRFANFLKATILIYGGQYTEEDLLKHVGSYIVNNFVKRPKFKIRIPLLTPLSEKIVFAIRKKIVKSVLEKTGIVKTLFAKGEESIPNAELSMKLMLEEKLLQIRQMLERSQVRRVEKIDVTSESQRIDIATLKAHKITDDLHLAIEEHSEGLMTFGRIVACDGKRKKLSRLDNRVQTLMEEVSELLPFAPPSLEELLKRSTTEITETALLSIFQDTDKQLETQATTLLQVLDKSFDYTPDNEKAAKDKKHRAELRRVDSRLSTLVEEISRVGVQTTLDHYISNVPAERHKKVLNYVEKEKKHLKQAFDQIEQKKNYIQSLSNKKITWTPAAPFSEHLKEQLAEATGLLVFYLDHISLELRSAEHEELCYADVRGDLNNLYASAARYLQQDLDNLTTIAQKIPLIQAAEEELQQAQSYRESFKKNNNLLSMNLETATPILAELKEQLPESVKEKFGLANLTALWAKRDEAQNALMTFANYNLLTQQIDDLETQQSVYKEVSAQISKLEHLLNSWKAQPSQSAVRLIKQQVALIKAHPESMIQEHIAPYLPTDNLSALYDSFHPGLMHTPTIKKNLSHLLFGVRTELKAQTKQLRRYDETKQKTFTFEGLSDAIGNVESEIAAQFKAFTAVIDAHSNEQVKVIIEEKTSLKKIFTSESSKKTLPPQKNFLKSVSALTVKGCLTLGDSSLINLFTPSVTGRVMPTIVEGTRVLIKAMGDPFHYKQLALRLVAVDLANSNTAAKKKK